MYDVLFDAVNIHLGAAVYPLYYLIDGFRGGFLGYFETEPLTATVCASLTCLTFFAVSVWLLKIGYKTKN